MNFIETTQPRSWFKRIIFIFVLIIAVAAIGSSFYFYRAYTIAKSEPAISPRASPENEIAGLVASIGKFLVLPQDETPTVATVTDPEKLKNQAFFANAKKGDKVIIYTKAKKAILYDPVQNKIIDVAPLNITAPD